MCIRRLLRNRTSVSTTYYCLHHAVDGCDGFEQDWGSFSFGMRSEGVALDATTSIKLRSYIERDIPFFTAEDFDVEKCVRECWSSISLMSFDDLLLDVFQKAWPKCKLPLFTDSVDLEFETAQPRRIGLQPPFFLSRQSSLFCFSEMSYANRQLRDILV